MPVLEVKNNVYTTETLLEIVRCLSTTELYEKLIVFTHPTSQLSDTGRILAAFMGYEYAFRESMSKRTPAKLNYQILTYLAKLPDVEITSKYRCRLDTLPGLNKYLYLCRQYVAEYQQAECLRVESQQVEYPQETEYSEVGSSGIETGCQEEDLFSDGQVASSCIFEKSVDVCEYHGVTDAFAKLSSDKRGFRGESNEHLAYSK